MNTKRDIWICSLLGLAALIVRMLLISKGPFSPESLNLALKAEQTVDTLQLQYMFGTGYPLTMIITAAAVFAGRFLGIDDPVLSANLMSVYASALSVPFLYLFVKRLLDVPAGIITALMFALCPIYMGVSVYGKGHAPAMLCGFASLWLLAKYLESRDAGQLFVSALLIGGMGAARVQDMVLLMPAAVMLMVLGNGEGTRPKGRELLADVCIFGITAAVTVVTFHLPFLTEDRRAAYFAQYHNFRQLSVSDLRDQNTALSLRLYRDWFMINFSGWGLLAAAAGLGLMLRTHWRVAVFSLLWFVCPAGFYMIIDTTIPRFFTILVPPVLILSGFFFAYGYRRGDTVTAVLGTVIALLISGATFFNVYPVLAERHRHAHVSEYVQWVKARVPPNAVIIAKDDFIFYEHYGGFETMPRPNPMGADYQQRYATYRERLSDMIRRGVPVYVSGVGLYSYDPGRTLSRYLGRYFEFREVGRHPYEIYHAGELKTVVFEDPLYRVVLK